MYKNILQKIFICVLGVLMFSCKKETDKVRPQITFHSPLENQFFNVYDQIEIKADITDETKITSATLSLVDANYLPVGISIPITVSSPAMTVNTSYKLNDIHFESGTYYLSLFVSDGTNDSRMYRKISIQGVPKVLKKIFVATSSSPYQTNLSFIDSSFSTLNFYHNFPGDCTGISSSSHFQEVFMCGYYNGSYSAISVADHSVKFNVASSGTTGSPYFTAFYSEEKTNYVAKYDETIKGYDYAGNITYNALANSGYYARKLIMNGSYLIAEEKHKTSSGKILVSFFSTGTAEQQKAISQDVVTFFEKDESNVFVFGNEAGQGVIQIYDRLNNNLWSPYGLMPSGSLLSAAKIDSNTFLIGLSNGIIYKYQYQNSNLIPYLNGYTAVKIKFDDVNKRIYIAESNRVVSVDYSSKTILNTINSSENILDISMLFNK